MSSNNTPNDQWFKTLAAEINPTLDVTEPAIQRVEEATSYPPASTKQNNPIADNEILALQQPVSSAHQEKNLITRTTLTTCTTYQKNLKRRLIR